MEKNHVGMKVVLPLRCITETTCIVENSRKKIVEARINENGYTKTVPTGAQRKTKNSASTPIEQ